MRTTRVSVARLVGRRAAGPDFAGLRGTSLMHQITPYPVWIGHAGDGRAVWDLLDQDIRAVVELAIEEPPAQPPRELIVCRVPLVDGPGNDPALLRLAIATVSLLLKQGIPTLVCCGAGLSRSPAIVAAALAVLRRAGLEDALTIVAEGHPADISPAFLSDVEQVLESGLERA